MSLIQDKLGGEFLRPNGGVDPAFGSGMLMFSHLPPVASFARLADLQPHDMMSLKKERDSPDCGGMRGGVMVGAGGGVVLGTAAGLGTVMEGVADYGHPMGIKQEKLSEHEYRLADYGGGGPMRNGVELQDVSLGNPHNLLVHDLSVNNLSSSMAKESSGKKGRRSNGEGHEGKSRKRRGELKSVMMDPDSGALSPNSKPHICEHCSAAFRSSYHLRRHVLIHTGPTGEISLTHTHTHTHTHSERTFLKPFSCDQCNMRFIQKYHMERHKRTHSGEKPYKCETCQQYFSRTDRLLKHKRTCADALRRVPDGGLLEVELADMSQGSYALTQGTAAPSPRKRAKPKAPGEGGKRKKSSGPGVQGQEAGYGLHHYSTLEKHGISPSSSSHPGSSMHQSVHGERSGTKVAYKKAGRKGPEKGANPSSVDLGGHGDVEALHGLGLLQAKVAPASSSNYDDAMQFVKKRRYLHAANGAVGGGAGLADYDVAVGHLGAQTGGVVSGVMDSDGPLGGLLDPTALDLKHDIKSGIPDEVLQSLLEHYAQKPDVTFDLSEPHHHHVELHPPSNDAPAALGAEDGSSSPAAGDKLVIMHEYSRFLLQALERTSGHQTLPAFGPPLGPSPSSSSSSSSSSFPGSLYSSDKHVVYTTSPLECGYGQATPSSVTSSSPSLPLSSSVPKGPFGLLAAPSPPSQHGFHLAGLEPVVGQQLTPSQELDKQHSSPAPQTGKGGRGGFAPAPARNLATLTTAKASFQIENFAQAFGGQFKAAGRAPLGYGPDSGVEVDHPVRTSAAEFSGFTSLLADVIEPVSSASKTQTSQSYR
uniref:Zinc finger protein 281 n=1 Tax=Denticeps clupeoides TaxID=299321 RepID=A0AAY4CK10_9TELE